LSELHGRVVGRLELIRDFCTRHIQLYANLAVGVDVSTCFVRPNSSAPEIAGRIKAEAIL
jgi:hypothetical protein